MGSDPAPRRVLLKLSGGVFAGRGKAPFDETAVGFIASELAQAHAACGQLAVVLGGGNIIRGARFAPKGPARVSADYAGMLATVLNALVLRSRLLELGVSAVHYGAFPVVRMVDVFEPERATSDLEAGRIVLLAGGTGNPFLTTDTAAALRAMELSADLLAKATRVEGVYSADPEKDPSARLYKAISYRQVLDRRLEVMDLAAVSLCMGRGLPVRVFDFSVPGNIRRAAAGEPIGTLIGSQDDGG
jgi:uridylate kinase